MIPRILILLLSITQLSTQSPGQAPEHTNELDLRVMSFNIRNSHARDGENHWHRRNELVFEVIRDYSPDLLGLQEANHAQQEELLEHFPEYGQIGTGSGGGTKGQYSSILYLKERFEAEASGTFWLSETPAEPSAHWGNHHLHICTWTRLVERDSNRPIHVYNTHMDDGSGKARENGARLIMQHILKQASSAPFVLMGDFNAPEESETIALIQGTGSQEGRAIDSFRALHPERKNVGTYNGFTGQTTGPRIDYIFVSSDARILKASILATNRNGRYPSDHFPVTARLRFE